jgi:hypothetical protein
MNFAGFHLPFLRKNIPLGNIFGKTFEFPGT